MEYKIGDKVKLKSLDWYEANKNDEGIVVISNDKYEFDVCFVEADTQYCGKIFTITDTVQQCYIFGEMKNGFHYCDEMIEQLVERHGKKYPYKIGERVELKGLNKLATIVDLKYNSWGNLTYYIKIDGEKDISIDYPTDLLLPIKRKKQPEIQPELITKQDKLISLNDACDWLRKVLYIHTEQETDRDWGTTKSFDWVTSDYDTVDDFINAFCDNVKINNSVY